MGGIHFRPLKAPSKTELYSLLPPCEMSVGFGGQSPPKRLRIKTNRSDKILEDIADAIAFLCGDARWLTGQNIRVNGSLA